MRFRALALSAALLLAACGAPTESTIDGSSPEAFRESMAAVRADLGPSERAKFEAALKLVQAEAFAAATSREEYNAELRRRLAGKTAEDVIVEASKKGQNVANKAIDAVFDIKRKVQEEARDLKQTADEAKGQ